MKKMMLFLSLVWLASPAFAHQRKDAKLELAAANGNTVSRAKLITDPKIIDRSNEYEVKSFILTFVPEGRDIIGPFTTKGNKLTAQEIDVIKRMQVPAKMVIEDILVTDMNGIPRKVSGIFLTVID